MILFPSAGCDWLIVGLGNPGSEYQNTRHNAGFMAVDRIADVLGVPISKVKYKALSASGLAVEAAAHFYKIPPERVLVLFEDISLPVGKIRVRKAGSAGGHNGIKSIIAMLHSENFPRVKIGIGAKPHPDYDLADWVLSSFTKQEQPELDRALDNARDAALCILTDGCEKAAANFNGK